MAEPTVKIAGRDVVAAGAVTLSPDDTTIAISFSGLRLKFIFEGGVSESPPEAIPELENPQDMLLRLKHFDRPFGTFYWSQIGLLDDRAIHVAINVVSAAAKPDMPPARLFAYTISLAEAGSGQ